MLCRSEQALRRTVEDIERFIETRRRPDVIPHADPEMQKKISNIYERIQGLMDMCYIRNDYRDLYDTRDDTGKA